MDARRLRPASDDPDPLDEPRDDAELVARAKHDPRAFAPLYRRYVRAVYRYCDRCLGDRDDAEDATAAVFARALVAIGTCRDEHAFRSWLFAIAHNTIADTRRAARPLQTLDAAADVADAAPGPEERAIAADDHREITTLLASIDPPHRELLELRLAGLTDAEIARVLGRSHGAIRTAQYRSIARLRALFGTPAAPIDKEGGRADR